MNVKKGNTYVYSVENLDCATCANDIEQRLNKLDFIYEANLTFATKKLKVTVTDNTKIDPIKSIQKFCSTIEDGILITKKSYKSTNNSENKHNLITIILGSLIFILGNSSSGIISTILYIIAYLLLGSKILLSFFRNIKKGKIFDENSLMSIATLGAFIIKQYPEAVGVMLFFRIGDFFETLAVEKSRKQIIDSLSLCPETIIRINGDTKESISPEDLNIGDIILIKAGDRIPVDGIIVDGESQMDTSAITGEPVPIIARVDDNVISGYLNTTGVIKIEVKKLLKDSMITRILESVEDAVSNKPKIDKFITKFSRIYTPIILLIALLTAIIPPLFSGNWYYWIYTALTFLVISCPCALILSVPLSFFSGIGRGSKKGILFKGGIALETIKNIKCIAFDKTGTLTKGNFIVQKITPTNNFTENDVISLAGSCELNSSHPIAISIMNYINKNNIPYENPLKSEEISGKGMKIQISKGTILCGNKNFILENNITINDTINYGTEIFISLNGTLVGYITISDTIKEDAKSSIKKIQNLGIKTAMLTGDTEVSANNVAKEIGIGNVFSKLLPQDKLSTLSEIREKFGSVMFVGDGINDAPVLAGADVGCAMGSGSDIAIETADVVFITPNLSSVIESINISKITIAIAKQNIFFAIFIKLLILILGLLGFASMWLAILADTGVSVLCILNAIRILYKK